MIFPDNGPYTGADYFSLDESFNCWNNDPYDVTSRAAASVDVDYDTDVERIEVGM